MTDKGARRITRSIFVLFAICAIGMQVSAQSTDYAKERAERAKELTTPYGWFSLVALNWLKPGTTTVGSAKDNSVVIAGAPAHLMTLEQTGGKVKLLVSDSSADSSWIPRDRERSRHGDWSG